MRLIEEVVTIYREEEKFRLLKSVENIILPINTHLPRKTICEPTHQVTKGDYPGLGKW